MYSSGDILLFSLSAQRQVPWRSFKKYFDEVQRMCIATRLQQSTGNAASNRWHALRILSCLAHIDLQFSSGDIHIVAAPPVLAALPRLGGNSAILCGARSQTTVRELEQAATAAGVEAIISSQPTSPYAPARVELRAENASLIHTVAEGTGLPYLEFPPARLLARVSASMQEYRQGLAWSKEPELNWRREDFHTGKLRFQPGELSQQQRLSRYQNPSTSIWRYRLWQNGKSAEIAPDWGRYAVLALASLRVLRYDTGNGKAFLPYGTPLPALLARAFGLCSGYGPELEQMRDTGRYALYRDVPPSIFNAVAHKIEQHVAADVRGKQWTS